jgi:predicted nucleic-acid-binding protein
MAKNNHSLSGYLDTNVLLRMVLADVPEQLGRIETRIARGERFGVSAYAIYEMAFVLERAYRLPHTDVLVGIRGQLDNPALICEHRATIDSVLSLYETYQKLSIVDCILLHEATYSDKSPLLTFDKDLQKAGGGFVVEP